MSVKWRAGRGSLAIGSPRGRAVIADTRLVVGSGVESEMWRARWSAIGIVVVAVLLGPFAPVVWSLVIINFFRRFDDPWERALLLKQIAGTLAAIPVSVFIFFLVGETMTDPGGLEGLVLIVLWSLPAAVLVAAIVVWPRFAAYLVGLLCAGVVAMDVWYASDVGQWRSFEDAHGPVVAVVSFWAIAAMVLAAWGRPGLVGGWMLLVSIVGPVLAMFVDELKPAAIASLAVGFVPGLLFVVSALLAERES